MLRKLRLRRKNGFLIKNPVYFRLLLKGLKMIENGFELLFTLLHIILNICYHFAGDYRICKCYILSKPQTYKPDAYFFRLPHTKTLMIQLSNSATLNDWNAFYFFCKNVLVFLHSCANFCSLK